MMYGSQQPAHLLLTVSAFSFSGKYLLKSHHTGRRCPNPLFSYLNCKLILTHHTGTVHCSTANREHSHNTNSFLINVKLASTTSFPITWEWFLTGWYWTYSSSLGNFPTLAYSELSLHMTESPAPRDLSPFEITFRKHLQSYLCLDI